MVGSWQYLEGSKAHRALIYRQKAGDGYMRMLAASIVCLG